MTHAALWSRSQQAFHVETVAEMLDKNQRNFAQNKSSDYVPIFIGSESDCRTMINHADGKAKLRKMFHVEQGN